jgi:Leucine-rich repeat (LRR) protein
MFALFYLQFPNITEFLDLARNYFSSSLSPDIAKLTNLKILVLDELSGLTGSLPNSLIRLTNLRDLRLRQTQMTAPIFDFIEYWPELENLDIGQSWVTGSIPTNIAVSNNKLKRL